MSVIDLTGRTIGQLHVIARAGSKGQQPVWMVRCGQCDKIRNVRGSVLRKTPPPAACYACTRATGGKKLARVWTPVEAACLGRLPDRHLSIYLGVLPTTVRAERERRGIPPLLPPKGGRPKKA